MAKVFRPIAMFGNNERKTFPTYAELKREMKNLIKQTSNGIVHVYRHKRGEWGEWFERWEMSNGKPVITHHGWM